MHSQFTRLYTMSRSEGIKLVILVAIMFGTIAVSQVPIKCDTEGSCHSIVLDGKESNISMITCSGYNSCNNVTFTNLNATYCQGVVI